MSKLHQRLQGMLSQRPMIHHLDPLIRVGHFLGEAVEDLTEAQCREAIDDAGGIHPDLAFVTADGIGVINVSGSLLNDGTDFYPGSFTCYGAMELAAKALDSDAGVHHIIFDIASGGGAASGCFELCDKIKKLNTPTSASIGVAAYSAAYAIASSCGSIWASKTSGSGSVGVVAVHMSFEQMLDEVGIDITLLHAGARKVDMNPFKDLSDEAKAEEMQQLEFLYTMFVDHVAARFDGDSAPVRATEARTFIGQQGIDVGFVDQIGTLADLTLDIRAKVATASVSGETSEAQAPVAAEVVDTAIQASDADYTQAVMVELETLGLQAELYTVLKEQIAVDKIAEHLGYNAEVTAMCETLGVPEKAQQFIQSRASMATVKETLLNVSAQQPDISSSIESPVSLSGVGGSTPTVLDAGEIYARRRAQRG